MKYIDEFRSKKLINKVAEDIRAVMPYRQISIMEVCGTHTHNFFRFGLNRLIPPNLKLIAGPGCPVCVSSQEYIDWALALSRLKDAIIVTFGDMLRVPGTESSLEKERACGASVTVVYSPLEALAIARNNPKKRVIFLGVGFETTTPAIALSMVRAKKEKLKNIFFLCSLKLITPAMKLLLDDKRLNVSGFLCPGHVSTIIGTKPYGFIPKKHKVGCCVCGFEPLDILEGIYMLLVQIRKNKPAVENQYLRLVKEDGNPTARKIVSGVFEPAEATWRGLGKIPGSGLKIKDEFGCFDAQKMIPVSRHVRAQASPKGTKSSFDFAQDSSRRTLSNDEVPRHQLKKCKCGDILKGLILPSDCPLFLKGCSPENPYGPCMVSGEGACNAYFRYR